VAFNNHELRRFGIKPPSVFKTKAARFEVQAGRRPSSGAAGGGSQSSRA
jgi:hypothetical protein